MTALQRELWKHAADRPLAQHGLLAKKAPSNATVSTLVLDSAPSSYAETDWRSLDASLSARSEALRAFEIDRYSRGANALPSQCRADNSVGQAPAPAVAEPAESARPPVGSGYRYPSYCAQRPTLAECFGHGPTPPASPARGPDGLPAQTRRERIEALERGIEAHDEARLRRLGAGTAPLLGADLQPLPLPVPPAPQPDLSELLHSRAKKMKGCTTKQVVRERLLAGQIIGAEVHERPDFPEMPSAARTRDRLQNQASIASPGASPRAGAERVNVREELTNIALRDTESLLRDAEVLVQQGASEERWCRYATQLCGRAYEVGTADVLRMVRTLGTASQSRNVRTARAKKELMRSADQLLSSLTARLQDADLEELTDVIEAMSDAGVGAQVFLDMIMAHVLARHHRDCQALHVAASLRLATALGRVSATLRLRPRGVGGPSTSTNMRVMDVLQKRIAERVGECEAQHLARLDSYYLTRLCDDEVQRSVVTRMAELQIGFRAATQQYLPLMVHMQDAIQRELSDTFKFTLPRQVRDYLTELKTQGLRETAPWALGDIFAPARTKLRCLRAVETVANT